MKTRGILAAVSSTVLLFGLAACGTDQPEETVPPVAPETTQPVESPTAEETPTDEASPTVEPPMVEPTEEATDETTGDLVVQSTGQQGPIGLSTDAAPEGEATEASGTFIVGPGSCFSLTDDDQPQLLIFGDDAEFVTTGGKPSVTTEALGTVEVGDTATFSVVAFSVQDAAGIPQQCAQGAAENALVVVN